MGMEGENDGHGFPAAIACFVVSIVACGAGDHCGFCKRVMMTMMMTTTAAHIKGLQGAASSGLLILALSLMHLAATGPWVVRILLST